MHVASRVSWRDTLNSASGHKLYGDHTLVKSAETFCREMQALREAKMALVAVELASAGNNWVARSTYIDNNSCPASDRAHHRVSGCNHQRDQEVEG